MSYHYTESFFRPKPFLESTTTTSAHTFNQYRLLLMQMKGNSIFVPVRDIQYQAILTENEVIFVNAEGGFAIDSDGEGGRFIDLAWHWDSHARDSLSEPVVLNITFYRANLELIQRQLLSLFPTALQAKLDIIHHKNNAPTHCRILPFRAPHAS
ncbi:MAG: hypothetical protein JKY87_03350 [Mariprofundus sp.]|nr:hypothetical protein [Mariprofundus sp.]